MTVADLLRMLHGHSHPERALLERMTAWCAFLDQQLWTRVFSQVTLMGMYDGKLFAALGVPENELRAWHDGSMPLKQRSAVDSAMTRFLSQAAASPQPSKI